MIEEQVRQIIKERVKEPKALKNAKLTAHQAICIAEALFPDESYIWEPVRKLNKIRNNLAHNTEPKDLEDQIDEFVKSIPWFQHPVEDKQKNIEFKFWALFEAVSSLVERPSEIVHTLPKGNK